MHCRETVKGWLQVRLVVTSFAERYRIRIQKYFTVLLLLVVADIIWQMSSHARMLSSAGRLQARLGLGAYVCILITVPSVIALTLQLAAGAYVNEQHSIHRDYLLTHRLLLREWAMDLGPAGQTLNGKRWVRSNNKRDTPLYCACSASCLLPGARHLPRAAFSAVLIGVRS